MTDDYSDRLLKAVNLFLARKTPLGLQGRQWRDLTEVTKSGNYRVASRERCQFCRNVKARLNGKYVIAHLRSAKHIAARLEVSPVQLYRAVRAKGLLDGTYQAPAEKKKGKKKKTFRSLKGEKKVARCLERFDHWTKREAKATEYKRKWERRYLSALAREKM